MAITREITYFNSYVVRKVPESGPGKATWPSLPWNPTGYPTFPLLAGTAVGDIDYAWFVEEARIRGGYNNTQTELGVRAFITENDDDVSVLGNGIIYSGLYNSNTGFNETNVFSIGQNIEKQLDPRYGDIKKLYSSDTNIVIFQEDKVHQALIDKDALYTGDGNAAVTSQQLVLGQIVPYSGEYGISDNPESFAYKGYRLYFTDKNRGAVMRLSRDGLTEISEYGLRDFFRDNLGSLNNSFRQTNLLNFTITSGIPSQGTSTFGISGDADNSVADLELGMQQQGAFYNTNGIYINNISSIDTVNNTAIITVNETVDTTVLGPPSFSFFKFTKDKVVGGYDNYLDKYVLSIQPANSNTYHTISFNDGNNGWTSFWDYKPEFIETLNNVYYTCHDGQLWQHYDETSSNRGSFYGTFVKSSIEFVFNPNASTSKVFKTINYEGSNGWEVNSIIGDPDSVQANGNSYNDSSAFVYSYDEGSYVEDGITYRAGFNKKENKYMCNIINNSAVRPDEVIFGDQISGIKGYYVTVTMQNDDTTDVGGLKRLFAVSSEHVLSTN
jgi:hypothetical protein